jgi:hypothetical protein
MKKYLYEGGNVFKDANVGKIKKENIEPTIEKFIEEMTRIFPAAAEDLRSYQTLGSVGKKPESGDIDLTIDVSRIISENGPEFSKWDINPADYESIRKSIESRAKTASPQQIQLNAMLKMIADKIENKTNVMSIDTKSTGGGSLHFLFPQFSPEGVPLDPPLNVQLDLMVGNQKWLAFSYYSDVYNDDDNIVKGLHRTQLMLAIFAHKGYTFAHGSGVKNKETNEVVATTPEQAIDLLNDLYGFNMTPEILQNYFKLRPFLEENLSTEDYNGIIDRYLKILDSTRADIPKDLQQYWIKNQEKLGLKGKFLPDDSKLKRYKKLQEVIKLVLRKII